MDAVASGGLCSPGETFTADGEVVWSWRRDPGVKPRGKSHAGDGGKKGRFTGESTKQSLKPLRGESRVVPAEPVVTTLVCFSLSHTRLRVRSAPGFPCALCGSEGQRDGPGENLPRE